MSKNEYELRTTVWLPLKPPAVFSIFSDAFKLESLTPSFLEFEVLTPAPIEMKQGQLIDYRLRLHGLPFRWRTRITQWEPPFAFEDSQIRGPYSLWVHSHTFAEQDGGTLMQDVVRYAVPGGPLIHTLFVTRDLRRIFKYRHDRLPQLLGVDVSECRPGEIDIRRLQKGTSRDRCDTRSALPFKADSSS
ncbi:MAG: SRPBCC family protein [Rhodopirellula sp.]|nr:SRPBCC family protein [Rhodopirellula sp.]